MLERWRLRARGLVLDVLTAGDPAGEPVLLHGFPQTAVCWTRLAVALANAGYRVLAPDQRGYSPAARPAAVPELRMKPRLRGVLHQYAFFVSLASGTLLVLLATTTRASLAAAIYAASVSALFGVSALYHRVTWTTAARRRMRRLDHAMILVLIAGTYTPVGLLVLNGTLATVVLAVVWGGALAGVAAHVLAISRFALPTG